MGEVWLGRLRGEFGFEKFVAIKTIREDAADSAHIRDMFLDELRILARLRHPNVTPILDVGVEGKMPFFAMEWVEGASLRRIYDVVLEQNGRVPVGILLRIVVDACAGLHAAHGVADARGRPLDVVHRDMSPDNILVSRFGIGQVIDFGIARAKGRLAEDTQSGVVRGKLGYMAPEQLLGVPLDRRADVWSVGAVVHRLLTERERRRDDPERALRGLRPVATGEGTLFPPLPDDAPTGLPGVVAKALAAAPAQRYASTDELGRAFEQVARDNGILETPTSVAAFLERTCSDFRADRHLLSQRDTAVHAVFADTLSEDEAERWALLDVSSPRATGDAQRTASESAIRGGADVRDDAGSRERLRDAQSETRTAPAFSRAAQRTSMEVSNATGRRMSPFAAAGVGAVAGLALVAIAGRGLVAGGLGALASGPMRKAPAEKRLPDEVRKVETSGEAEAPVDAAKAGAPVSSARSDRHAIGGTAPGVTTLTAGSARAGGVSPAPSSSAGSPASTTPLTPPDAGRSAEPLGKYGF
jgi:serine/threonine-protein kinase